MTRDEQINFVVELASMVTAEIVANIEAGKIPDNWDSIELRQFLADCFSASVFKHQLTGTRRREYNNTVLVNNL